MIEQFPYVQQRGFTPDTRPVALCAPEWVEGSIIPPPPPLSRDECVGQTTGRPCFVGQRKLNGRHDKGASDGNL